MKLPANIQATVAKVKSVFMPTIARATEALNMRSPREKMMIIFFGITAIFVLDYVLWIAPVGAQLSQAWTERSGLKTQISELREYESSKNQIVQRHEQLMANIAEDEKRLVGPDQIPALLENLSKTAHKSQVKITSLSPLPPPVGSAKNIYQDVPIQILATAGTHELGRFLDALENGAILIQVTRLKIAADAAGGRQHKIDLELLAHRIQEASHA